MEESDDIVIECLEPLRRHNLVEDEFLKEVKIIGTIRKISSSTSSQKKLEISTSEDLPRAVATVSSSSPESPYSGDSSDVIRSY